MMMSFRGGVFKERKKKFLSALESSVVVVVFFVVERKREESKVESVVVVVLVVVALSRGKESSLGRLSHPLHPKEREKRKTTLEEEEEENTHAKQRVFFGLFFRLFFVVFGQTPAKIVSFPLFECDPKTKRDCLGYRFFFFLDSHQ